MNATQLVVVLLFCIFANAVLMVINIATYRKMRKLIKETEKLLEKK